MRLFKRKAAEASPSSPANASVVDVKEKDSLEKEGSGSSPLSADLLARLELQGASKAEIKKVGPLELWRYATWREMLINSVGLFAAIASGVAQPAMTIALGGLTTNFTSLSSSFILGDADQAIQDAFLANVDKNLKILVGIGAGNFVMTYLYSSIWQISGEILSRRIRERYLAGVLRQNIGYIETVGAGEVSTRITTDTNLFQAGISDKVPMLVQFSAMFVGGFVIAFVTNWRITVVLLAIVPAIVLAGAVMGTVTTKAKQKSLEHLSAAGTLAEEAISSVRVVQAFGTQDRLAKLYDVPNELAWRMGRKFALGTAFGVGSFFFIIYSAYALAFYWGTTQFLDGNATVGNIITCFFALIIGAFSLSEAAPCLTAIISATSAAAKLYDVIERQPPIDSGSSTGRTIPREQLKGHLELRNVVFRYPSRPAVPVLNGISLTFPAGQTSALVGASGCGKSTITALLLRFYDALDGEVLLDGVPLNDLNVRWLRSQIGVVFQEPTLFSESVYKNVAHGLANTPLESLSEEDKRRLVEEACVKANADAFVRALPDGYETRIGERGLLLSGGQRQRIAIARAIVSNPTILILDEATSALDTKSERIVQDALDKASKGRTTVAIAHRLSTIRKAEAIHVVAAGQVIESGTHVELLNKEGAYAKLVEAQRMKEASTDTELPASSGSSEEMEKVAVLEEDQQPGELGRHKSVASEVLATQTEDKKQKYGGFQVLKRLFGMNKAEWRLYIAGVAGSTALGCVYPVFSLVFGHIIGVFTNPNRDEVRSEANTYSGYLFAIACCSAVFMTVAIFGWNYAAEALGRKMRLEAFRKTLKMDISFFDKESNSVGTLTSNISDNAEKVTALFGSTGGVIVQGLVTIFVGLVIGLAYSWQIALVGFSMLPFTVTGGLIRLYVVVLKDTRNDAQHAKSAQLACEAANAVRTVASLTRESDVVQLYSNELDEPQRRTIRFAIIGNGVYAFSQASSFWILSLVFWYGSRLLIKGDVSTTNFYIALQAVTFGALEVGNIFMYVPDASKAYASGKSFLRLMDARPLIDIDSTEGKKLDSTNGHIEVDNVHFRYATRPHVPVLRGLSLDLKPGQYVALVGPSGCGKSTMIALLERFYDPLTGSIRLDGSAVNEMNVSNYRSFVSLVAQESALYAGSVRTNVLLGSAREAETVTQAELEEACRAANIHDFVSGLPDGYETQLGGKGAQLSGGQRQRVALARALIRKPEILLLDEATSALDSESERIVQAALDEAAKGRSTIAVAHRLSTIKNADTIYVFDQGRIVERGTHDQLLAKRGIYFELVSQQSLEK